MSANISIVTEMQVIPVAGYNNMEMTFSGVHAPYFTRNPVIIENSPGHIGTEEIHGGNHACECLASRIPLVVGQEVGKYRSILGCIHRGGKQAADDDEEGIQALDTNKLKFVVEAEWAIECALLDLLGQHLGIPVCEFLAGGKQRDRAEILGYLFYILDKNETDLPYLDESQSRDPRFRMRCQEMVSHEQIVEQTCCLQDRYGYRNFKLKGGVLSGDYGMDTVRALEKQFPQGRINIDPNGAWSLEEAVRLCRDMGSILSYIEDLCGPGAGFPSREIMAEFKNVTGLLVATDMITINWRQFYHAAALEAVDIVPADPHFWGLERNLCVAAFFNDWGLTWGSHSNNHSDITLTTLAYVATVAPGSPTVLDTRWIRQDGQNLLKDTPVIGNNYLEIPDCPGLGVTLGMDQVTEANKLYNRMSSHDRDDAMAMQCLVLGWICGSKKPCLVG